MSLSSPRKASFSLCAALALAGCGGTYGSPRGSEAMPPSYVTAHSNRGWILPAAKSAKELLYVGDPTSEPSYTGAIDIFAIHGLKYTLVGKIQDDDGPDGMTTDSAGNLYVTDEGVATEGPAVGDIKCSGTGVIDVYSEATGKLGQQISVPNAALWEAFNEKRSRLYVSNFEQVEILSYPAGNVIGQIDQPGWSKSAWPTGVAFWPPPSQ